MRDNIKLLTNIAERGGFTLVEIIIIMVITSVMASAALSIADGYIQSEHAIATIKQMKTIAKAENLYYEGNTTPYTCTVNVGGTNYSSPENFHIYTNSFSNLAGGGYLGSTTSDVNYFGQAYSLIPQYSAVAVNSNNFCVRESGIEVMTYIPVSFKGAVNTVSGAFDIGQSGSMEEIGYYSVPEENNPEMDATLKYNW